MERKPLHTTRAALALGALALLAACAAPQRTDPRGGPAAADATGRNSAMAHLVRANGEVAGHAELRETAEGVEVSIEVRGLSPGLHGFHIHTTGVCAPGPDAATGQTVAFGAAGGHFDPGHSQRHGQPGSPPNMAHAGELPNLSVGADGRGTLRYVNRHVSLSNPATSVVGRSLVVHERPDDYTSNPAGNSGPRELCGVIEGGHGRSMRHHGMHGDRR